MKHTLKKSSDTQVVVTVTATADELETAKAAVLKTLARNIKVDGFRKGKVPPHVAEKHLDANALANDVVEEAVNHTLNEVIAAETLRVLDQPQIQLKKFVPFTDLEYEATLEIIPDITLGNYKKLKVKKTVKKVTDKDIADVVERLLTNSAEKTTVKRAAADGDEVTIDFVGKKDGEAFDGGTATDYPLAIGSKTFIPGFEDALVGHKTGESFDVPLKFPKDYHEKSLAGQPVVFAVTVKNVQAVKKPTLDDRFAKKVGPFSTVDELKKDIRRELEAQAEREADDVFKDELIGALVKSSKVPVPEVLVQDQLRSVTQDAKQNLLYRGVSAEDYMKANGYADEQEWAEKEFTEAATRRVQSGLVLAELSKVEKVDISTKELEERLAEMKQQFPNMNEQLDTAESRRDLANRVMTEKTLSRLVELNS